VSRTLYRGKKYRDQLRAAGQGMIEAGFAWQGRGLSRKAAELERQALENRVRRLNRRTQHAG
jgi:hypothetical protein